MATVQVLYDKNGNILSVGDTSRGPTFGVQPGEGQYAEHLEVPPEYTDVAFHEFSQKLKVDVTKRQLVAK